MTNIRDAVSEIDNSAVLLLEVSAGSKKTHFPAGYNEWRKTVQCRIKTPPVEGRANKAIIIVTNVTFGTIMKKTRLFTKSMVFDYKCIASEPGVPRAHISLISGATSSLKRIRIDGMSGDTLVKKLYELMSS